MRRSGKKRAVVSGVQAEILLCGKLFPVGLDLGRGDRGDEIGLATEGFLLPRVFFGIEAESEAPGQVCGRVPRDFAANLGLVVVGKIDDDRVAGERAGATAVPDRIEGPAEGGVIDEDGIPGLAVEGFGEGFFGTAVFEAPGIGGVSGEEAAETRTEGGRTEPPFDPFLVAVDAGLAAIAHGGFVVVVREHGEISARQEDGDALAFGEAAHHEDLKLGKESAQFLATT